MEKLKAFISSPYTNGNQANNVRRQLDAQEALMKKGFVALAPLIQHFAQITNPSTEDAWLQWDLEWLKVCDFVIRIRPIDGDGKELYSSGSDIECRLADELKIPVYEFSSVDKLKFWLINYEADDILKDIERLKS